MGICLHAGEREGKNMKRFIKYLILLWMISFLTLLGGKRSPVLAQTKGLAIMMIIDLSGSMKHTDPNGVALEGAKLFIDMLETSGSRAGFVAFSDKIERTQDFVTLNSMSDKNSIKAKLGELSYSSGDTDIGAALMEAVGMFKDNNDVGNDKVILLFTDGKIDLPKGAPNEVQAEAVSRSQANSATDIAVHRNIPIYTLGLNADGALDQELISDISYRTAARTFVVENAHQLPDAFNGIFADFIESQINNLGTMTITDSDIFAEKVFTIPNDSVVEANIVMITGGTGTLDEVEVIDPAGNRRVPDDITMQLSKANSYNMLKLVGPSYGNWRLRIKGTQGCQIHLNLLFNYDVVVEGKAAETSPGSVQVTGTLTMNGVPIDDDILYGQMIAATNVLYSNGNISNYPMQLGADNKYICTVPISPGQTCRIRVHVEGANMYRNSQEMVVTGKVWATPTPAPSPTPTPSPTPIPSPTPTIGLKRQNDLPDPIEISSFIVNMGKKSFDLDDIWASSNPQESSISYTADVVGKDIAEAEVKGSKLTVRAKKKGNTTLTVIAKDDVGNVDKRDVAIDVEGVLNSILPLAVAAAAVLALIILWAVRMRIKPGPLTGSLYYSISVSGDFGKEDLTDLGTFGTKTTLSQVIFDQALDNTDLSKVFLKGMKGVNKFRGIIISNKSKSCELKDNSGIPMKTYNLHDKSECSLDCTNADGNVVSIALRYEGQ